MKDVRESLNNRKEKLYELVERGKTEEINRLKDSPNWEELKWSASWQNNYQVMAYKECASKSDFPLYYEVIKKAEDTKYTSFYKLKE